MSFPNVETQFPPNNKLGGRKKGSLNRTTYLKKYYEAKETFKNPINGKVSKLTQGDIIALSMIKEARSGNVQAFNTIMDNLFGKQKDSLQVDSNNKTDLSIDIKQSDVDNLLRKFKESNE